MKKQISINESFIVTFIYGLTKWESVYVTLKRLNFNVSYEDLTEINKPKNYKLMDYPEVIFWVDCKGLEEAALLTQVLGLADNNSAVR